MQKRISALLLAVVIVIGSVLGGNTLKVKAASVAVSEEFAVELTMMLYNLLETVAISSGIKDGLDDYESGSSLYDAFIASVESMAEPPFYDTIITQPDGSQVTVKEALDAVESTLGSNALKLPTSETFAKYRVISGTGGNEPDPTPTPSSDPDNTPVPDTGYKDPFTYIQDVLVSSTLLSAMAGIFADLYAGKIDGIDSTDFYSVPYNNYNLPVFDYSYLSSSSTFFSIDGSTASYVVNPDPFVLPEHCYYACVYQFSGSDYDCFSIMYVHAVGDTFYYDSGSLPCIGTKYSDGSSFSANVGTLDIRNNVRLSTNIPFFDSHDSMKKFFNTYMNKGLAGIDVSGLLNGEAYDFPDLATSTAERLQPLTGYEFAPGRLPGINAALSTAAAALPEPGLDPAENTEAYKKTLNAALTAALPEPAPEPEPDPDPSPSPDPGTGGEGESYKRDLKLLFPFCIPFDFIHLIQALKAEPETPKFEIPVKLDFVDVDTSIVIDLAWMDPIMKIWRLGELGLFIVMLMKSTSKMIRW